MARPTDYTEDLAKQICALLADGLSLREISAIDGMPDKSTILRWVAKDAAFRDQYAQAREVQAEGFADEILEIADDASNDTKLVTRGDSDTEVCNSEWITRSRLRVDTRKWLMSKLLPKKYGDRLLAEHSGPDGGPIEISDTEAARRIAAMLVGATKG